jgi:hypothetical protein
MSAVDGGTFPRNYDPEYWAMEAEAAWERSWGDVLARAAETILYCRRPIEKFVDIGSGPGFLVDSLSTYLPASRSIFYGVELFPPEKHTDHPNYLVGHLADVEHKFDAGVCVEVIEHLTPKMVDDLAKAMAAKSNPKALYLINTCLSYHVRTTEPEYMDPLRRGHIVSWSLKAIETIFGPYGFKVFPIKGKSWAFCLEYLSEDKTQLQDRIWAPDPQNRGILNDSQMGRALYVMGMDAARAYIPGHVSMTTRWRRRLSGLVRWGAGRRGAA